MSGLIAVATETAPRCKLCQNAHRTEIDELIALRSQRLKKTPEILVQLAEWGVENPTADNLKMHLKNHVELVTPEEYSQRADDVDEVFTQILGDGWQNRVPTPDEANELVRALAVRDLYRKAKEGKGVGLTADHLLKSVAEATKRKSDERVGGLLGTLVGALTERQQRQLPPVVVEHEPIEEAEVSDVED